MTEPRKTSRSAASPRPVIALVTALGLLCRAAGVFGADDPIENIRLADGRDAWVHGSNLEVARP